MDSLRCGGFAVRASLRVGLHLCFGLRAAEADAKRALDFTGGAGRLFETFTSPRGPGGCARSLVHGIESQ